ncbi:MAG: SUMF1/EgtB/PvdO family nonheme iron enzyme [Magnetococcales bacterium]|nr:SUMF1/EgtB/PvdO family nonheme iron enzyme [Magnetococcales bacterium]
MEQIQDPIPLILIDMAGFSILNEDTQIALVKRLQQGIRESIQPMIGGADPDKIIGRHGTGDGYFLFLEGYSIPVAMRFAWNLEQFLHVDKKRHPGEEPLRLRIGMTWGKVSLIGDQYHGNALTQAERLINHDWIKEVLQKRPDHPLVLVASAPFWNRWNQHPRKSDSNLAFPEDRPWIEETLIVKHEDAIPCHIQVEPDLFSQIHNKISSLIPWLKSLRDRTMYIRIEGIGSSGGNQQANRYPIETLFTPLKTRSYRDTPKGNTERQAILEGSEAVNLATLLPQHRHLFIEGQPGTGKSTFLHLIAATLAKDWLGEACPEGGTWRKRFLGMEDGPPPAMPLFLKLWELAQLLVQMKPPNKADDRYRLLDLLQTTPDAHNDQTWRKDWEQRLTKGTAMLLLDGLDEVADVTVRGRMFDVFQNAVTHWPKCPIIVTSRPISADLLKSMGFHRTVIDPFETPAIQEFINRWSTAIFNQESNTLPIGEANRHADLLGKAILNKPAIRKLATNPVMLTCLCIVHWNEGRLPEGRARVYDKVIEWLMLSRKRLREEHGYTSRFALAAFTKIALTMMGLGLNDKKAAFDLDEAATIALPLYQRHILQTAELPQVRDWVHFECFRSGIMEETSRNKLRFWHLTFQEYLAARALAEMDKEDWWPIIDRQLVNPQWRETVDLFPGVLLKGGDLGVDELLSRILNKYPGQSLNEMALKAGILGRILEPLNVYDYQPEPAIKTLFRQALERSLELFTPEGAASVPIAQRLPAAEALGQGGDPRLADDQWQKNMIRIPGTNIHLGKYLVTVMEYQRFIEDGGYANPDFWQEDRAWSIRQAEGWNEPKNWPEQLDHPNRPVVGVSWYEACAYCLWLSKERKESFHLPDENDWQQAAAPDDRTYPWGNEGPTPERANYLDGKIGAPSPVGLYPMGDGLYGHCDLAGNVWEWSASPWAKGGNKGKYGPQKVVRGGSWVGPDFNLRGGGRVVDGVGGRGDDLGFRLAAPPAFNNKTDVQSS